MKKILLLFISLALFFNSSDAQTKRSKNKKLIAAQDLFANYRYKGAKKLYSELLKSEKGNLEYNFYTGICELYTDEEDKAMEHFDFIINDYKKSKKESDYTKAAVFYKAKVYHNLYQFDEEVETLKTLSSFALSDNEKKEMETSINNADFAKQLFFDFKPIIVTRLDILNSGYDDHTPVPTANGSKLYFTSKRPGGISGEAISEEGKYFEDIWSWEENSEPVNIGLPVNTKEHDATGGLSLDGKIIFIYKSSEDRLGDIYTSTLENNSWTEPKKLGKNINKRKSTERHVALSPDGKTLYFSSDRKDGKGGRDIWVSNLKDDGTWGEPSNININTKADEESPYMLSDGMTFYFSSKGHKGMGGYDIFKCMLQNDGTFSEPVNVGFPINTVEDDVFFFPLSDEQTAYFTRRKSDNAEIFKTIFPDNSLIVESEVKGKEIDKDLYPIDKGEVTVIDINSEEHPDAYTLNLEKGKYKTVVVQDKNYKFYYESPDYVFDTENITTEDMLGVEKIEKNPILVKIEEGKTVKFKNTGFDENSSDFNDYTRTELDLIAENLNKYENLVVNFSTEDYTKTADELSKERKNKAVDYIKSKGIDSDRIYTDLSSRDIPNNTIEYTIYDILSVKKAIEDKEKRKEVTEPEDYIVEIENVYFNFDKSKLQVTSNDKLDLLAKYLADNSNAKIEIIGYTDAVGSSAYNNKLSAKRAKTVKAYLTEKGAAENQVITSAYGEDNPVTVNKKNGKYFEESKKYNRRVEFRILSQGKPNLKIIQFKNIPEEYKDTEHNSNYKK
ncbi:MAG: OmpA family protein [Bacteroidales bacterium]|nr:OmpA family protein [Bacteroidales bacterium]